MILTINGKQAALKKGSSIEYVSENRIFTDADDYSMEIELPLADCPQNLDIFGMITRKDVDAGDIFFDAVLQDTNFFKRGAVVIPPVSPMRQSRCSSRRNAPTRTSSHVSMKICRTPKAMLSLLKHFS